MNCTQWRLDLKKERRMRRSVSTVEKKYAAQEEICRAAADVLPW
jgi:hypothetical protein